MTKVNDKLIQRTIYTLSFVIPLAVAGLMFMTPSMKESLGLTTSETVSSLPLFHAILNGLTFVLLVLAGMAIRVKNIKLHSTMVWIAFALSSIFLISYVLYHTTTPSSEFGGEGWISYVYFFILISHIVLSVPVLPLALFAIYRGWTKNVLAHRALVKYAYPVWLYVALSGVLVYVFMRPYYG